MAGNANPLTIYGPAGTGEFVETTLRLSGSWTDYPLEVIEITEGLVLDDGTIPSPPGRSTIRLSAMATALKRMISPARSTPLR
ncbi:ribonuclease Z [Enterobacter cloacae]|uniref:Ribonuclease Z n=1 Tax=Enterobacter cloacae TaxID=550 RepID=A0A377LX19_ENTCL|nr:ribonuclease Z [Enterobacter cloacae]